jgi:hypothetical protein
MKFYNSTNVTNYTRLLYYIEFINKNTSNDICFDSLVPYIETEGEPFLDDKQVRIDSLDSQLKYIDTKDTVSDGDNTPHTQSPVSLLKHYFESIDNTSNLDNNSD